jgi:REP element-mobilizing transposase RayT
MIKYFAINEWRQIYNQRQIRMLFCYVCGYTLPARCSWVRYIFKKGVRDIIVDSLNYCINEKELVAGVPIIIGMSNHIHLIITTKTEQGNISAIISDFKKFSQTSPRLQRGRVKMIKYCMI